MSGVTVHPVSDERLRGIAERRWLAGRPESVAIAADLLVARDRIARALPVLEAFCRWSPRFASCAEAENLLRFHRPHCGACVARAILTGDTP